MAVSIGSRVIIPFGRRNVIGFVMAGANTPDGNSPIEIKDVLESPDDAPVFSGKMVELIRWVSDYYFVPIGEMCKAALPLQLSKKIRKRKGRNFEDETIIDDPFNSPAHITLTEKQKAAYESFCSSYLKYSTTLLHGITGSGKTEIYLKLFEDILARSKSAIFMVPEIGMTPQTVSRISARFKDKISVYHSGLSDSRRFYEWRRIKSGSAKIVVGTRSSVFAPFANLGLIVIDEEHDTSYKQDESPRYNGRDTAIMRAKIEGVQCILGSATPSVETFTNVQTKKYHYLYLSERPSGAPLPNVEIIDMRGVPKNAVISPTLVSEIGAALHNHMQAILFINRRGYGSFILCTECGSATVCPNCNITLSYHKEGHNLLCHYCEYKIPMVQRCLKCGSASIRAFGSGTERIEDEIKTCFPSASVARFDRDATSKAHARPKILSQMKSGKIDILIGTQMITKGHDFPNIALVGVLDADLSLNFPDFRAAERTFQLLAQVAGRAGRRETQGKVIIQTFNPENYAIRSAARHNFFDFYKCEFPIRRELLYPPFGRLVLVKIEGANEQNVEKYSHAIVNSINIPPDVLILGPSPAPLTKVRGKFRWHFLIKSKDIKKLKAVTEQISGLQNANKPKGIKVSVDVDPVNML
ncbi:MAG: primosomal protein N' [Deltaproteobacteria bacterium]|nr:primosomal protein N' [Deltaproteobacteria bacterium]